MYVEQQAYDCCFLISLLNCCYTLKTLEKVGGISILRTDEASI